MGKSVVVGGMGVLSPAGRGVDALWTACASGGANFRPIEHFDVSRAGATIAGFVPVDEEAVPPGDARRIRHLRDQAVAAALADAGVGDEPCALVLAATDSGGCPDTRRWRDWRAHGRAEDTDIAADPPVGGPVFTVANASAAGAAAIAFAADLIREAVVPRAVVCGVDTVTETAFNGLASLRALSPGGCRPFSPDRSGIRISECAAAIVLREGPSNGVAVRGWGVSNLAGQHARPEADAVVAAVESALAVAGADPADVGYVNAHAAGTRQGDAAEIEGLRRVFGDRLGKIPLASSKSAVGHCQGAAGTVEAIVTVETLRRQLVLPTRDLREPDPRMSDLNLVFQDAEPTGRLGLTISCGLGGATVALLFGVDDE